MVETRGIWKTFARGRRRVEALRDVTLEIEAGNAVALVGASGSGKSTLARCLAGLLQVDQGAVVVNGKAVSFPSPVQLVFQHPALSIHPTFDALRAIAEPLEIGRVGSAESRREQALRLMEQMELAPALGVRRVRELSGGEQARVALARALCALGGRTGLIIVDETLSSLDLPLARRMVRLLDSIRREQGAAILLITHDWNLATSFGERLWVMYGGRIGGPECEAGRALAAAAPAPLGKDGG